MFHSKTLSQSVSALEALTPNFKKKADQASEDIRQLEKYLSQKWSDIEIGIEIGDHKLSDEHWKLLNLAGMGEDLDFLLKEFLTWEKSDDSESYRLQYKTLTLKGNAKTGYQIHPERSPLLECSVADRIRLHGLLPLLVQHMKEVFS